MRELFINYSDSTKTSLVFETEEGDEFFVAVTEELTSIVNGSSDSGSHFGLSPVSHITPAIGVDDEASDDDIVDAEIVESDEEPSLADAASDDDATNAAPEDAELADKTEEATAPHGPRGTRGPYPVNGQAEKKNRPYSDAMSMRPAEIQARVRAGASAGDLAEEMGVAESRVEPFAYPVMLERTNIAELAKQAHPVREDGPAKLTLWEVLATSFAARGHSLSDAEWTAYREQAQPWVIKVTWKAGLSENEALWTFKQSMSSPSTVEARNSVAADLTDPDFVQPVRTLTSIGRGSRYDEAIDGPSDIRPKLTTVDEDYTEDAFAEDDRDAAQDSDPSASAPNTSVLGVYDQDADTPAADQQEDSDSNDAADDGSEASGKDEFLQHPDPDKKPTKRRRKAVTPHWEDVLLGVRANTKRPRS